MPRPGPILAALLAAATVATAQPPAPPAPTPQPDPVAAHLAQWEKTMGQLVNFGAEFDLVRKDNVFKQSRTYGGSVLCMKPNLAILRIESKTDKNDYEAFLSNGKSVYHYDGPKKLITEFKLNPAGGADNLMLDFLGGMKAGDAQRRFKIGLVNQDANYVILAIEPLMPRDKQEFTDARLALLAPTNVAKLTPYLPAVVWLQQPNGNTEEWRLRNHKVNQPGVEPKLFEFQMVKGFQFQQAPPPAPPGPAPGPQPAGGVPPRP